MLKQHFLLRITHNIHAKAKKISRKNLHVELLSRPAFFLRFFSFYGAKASFFRVADARCFVLLQVDNFFGIEPFFILFPTLFFLLLSFFYAESICNFSLLFEEFFCELARRFLTGKIISFSLIFR